MNYTFIALVENKPGVLNRVASLFRRRNFNIESLAVGRTQNPDVSRMTIVVDCPNGDMDAHRIEANLYKLVNVIDVQDVTHQPNVTRDLALIKVMVAPERRAEVNGLAEIFRARIVENKRTIPTTSNGSVPSTSRASSRCLNGSFSCLPITPIKRSSQMANVLRFKNP